MNQRFLEQHRSLLTVMLQCNTPEIAIMRIRNALCRGAEAFGLQTESLFEQYRNKETLERIFNEMRGRPCYVTNYRNGTNRGKTDEQLAQELLEMSPRGQLLCDVMGDLFCPHPDELTEDPKAIEKQMKLIDAIHSNGSEVLMSSHILRFTPAERVLEVAREQVRRGADVVKIVTWADSMEQQLENLRITDLLKRELGAPFLFLSGGECSLHRRLGIRLGCCMALCVYEHDSISTATQPLLATMKNLRDNIDL